MAADKQIPEQTGTLYDAVSKIIEEARGMVYRTANFTMIQAYWQIGRAIVEEEQNGRERAEYGIFFARKRLQVLLKDYRRDY